MLPDINGAEVPIFNFQMLQTHLARFFISFHQITFLSISLCFFAYVTKVVYDNP